MVLYGLWSSPFLCKKLKMVVVLLELAQLLNINYSVLIFSEQMFKTGYTDVSCSNTSLQLVGCGPVARRAAGKTGNG
jgi:hypothetical protein